MKFELKKYKAVKELSQETTAFSAELWAAGKLACSVTNDGHGGSNMCHWNDRAAEAEFTAQAKKMFPAYEMEPEDMLIAAMAREQDIRKTLTRWCKTKTIFLVKGDDPRQGWRQIVAPFDLKVKGFLIKKYGQELGLIANEDLEAAVAAESAAYVAHDNQELTDMLSGDLPPFLAPTKGD